MGWESFGVVGFDRGPVLQGRTYSLHLNSYLVTFLHNTICREQLFCPSVRFRISFEHAVQLPFANCFQLFIFTFPDNYAFLSLLPSQIKNTQSADRVPIHGHSPLVKVSALNLWSLCTNFLNSLPLCKIHFAQPLMKHRNS